MRHDSCSFTALPFRYMYIGRSSPPTSAGSGNSVPSGSFLARTMMPALCQSMSSRLRQSTSPPRIPSLTRRSSTAKVASPNRCLPIAFVQHAFEKPKRESWQNLGGARGTALNDSALSILRASIAPKISVRQPGEISLLSISLSPKDSASIS
jgi:hypothetical protein